MKTKNDLNADILKITMIIHEKFPELSKYILEMPISIPDVIDPEISIKNLNDYYESLTGLLKRYAVNHSTVTKEIMDVK
ncbi:hypothetical protein [Runella sp.]|uniref:hypothetical protein n=1 Tax=Runella sp. TaxID=1960881 RepID=UPI003D0D8454